MVYLCFTKELSASADSTRRTVKLFLHIHVPSLTANEFIGSKLKQTEIIKKNCYYLVFYFSFLDLMSILHSLAPMRISISVPKS